MSGKGKFLAILSLIAVVYLISFLWLGNYGSFWSEDGGVKYLQVRSLARSHWSETALDYSGAAIDPRLEFNPLAGNHTRIREGRIYSIYPVSFPFLSSLIWSLLGHPGLYLLPLLAGLISAGLTYALGRMVAGEKAAVLSALVCGLATPIWFYSLTFWEITLASALLIGGLFQALRLGPDASPSRTLRVGFWLGAVVFFRTELILVALAYLAVRLVVRRDLRQCGWLAVGVAADVAGFFLLQLLAEGSLLTQFWHNIAQRPAEYAPGNFLAYKFGLIRELLFPGSLSPGINLLLLVPVLLFGAWLIFRARRSLTRPSAEVVTTVIFFAVLAVALGRLIISLTGDFPIRSTPFTSGLLLFSPWVVLAVYRPRGGGVIGRELFWTTSAALGLLIIAIPTSGGLQWGPRYLVPLYPLFAVLSVESFLRLRADSRWPGWLTAIFLVMLAFSTGLQGRGVTLLRARKVFNQSVMEKLTAAPSAAIAAQPWWVPLSLAALFPEREFFAARSPEQLSHLVERLREVGREELILIVENDRRVVAGMAEIDGLELSGIDRVDSEADDYFSLIILRYRLQ